MNKNNPPCIKNNPPCNNQTTGCPKKTSKEKEKVKENVNKKEKANTHINNNHVVSVCEKSFLSIWTSWGSPFTNPYIIKDLEFWNKWWDNCRYTEEEIYKALRNVWYCVNNGHYESRYISADPCKFIQGNMLERGLDTEMSMYFDMENPDEADGIIYMSDKRKIELGLITEKDIVEAGKLTGLALIAYE